VAFVLEDQSRLERVIELLPPGRLAGLVQTASEDDLWLEALDLLDHLTGPPREMLAAELTARGWSHHGLG
jgi:predicted KAP-like P-loop ATPase